MKVFKKIWKLFSKTKSYVLSKENNMINILELHKNKTFKFLYYINVGLLFLYFLPLIDKYNLNPSIIAIWTTWFSMFINDKIYGLFNSLVIDFGYRIIFYLMTFITFISAWVFIKCQNVKILLFKK